MAFGRRPITSLQKLLHEKLGPNEEAITSPPSKISPEPKQNSQNVGTENDNDSSKSQNIHFGDLPSIIQASVATIKKESDAPVYVNLNLNNQQVSSNAITKKLGEQASLPASRSNFHAHSLEEKSKPWFSDTKTVLYQQALSLRSWIVNNKLRLFLISSTGFFASIQGLLWYIGRILISNDCWSSWHAHCSLSTLYQMNQKDLMSELLKDIQRKTSSTNTSDLVAVFLKEIHREMNLLNRYIVLASIAQRWPLKYLMITNSQLTETISWRKDRLTYLKNLALGWLKQQKNSLFDENLTTTSSQEAKGTPS